MKYLALITLLLFIGCNAHRTSLSDDKDNSYAIQGSLRSYNKTVVLNPKKMLDNNYISTYFVVYEKKKIKLGNSIIELSKNDTIIKYIKLGE